MSLSTTENWQRYGRQIDADMTVLDEAVDHFGIGRVGGAWWQGWKGFYGGWTQYYQGEVKPNPISPLHDDSDLTEFANKLDVWKKEFSSIQATVKAADAKAGTPPPVGGYTPTALLDTTSTQGETTTGKVDDATKGSSLGWLIPLSVALVGTFGVAYLLSSAAKLKSAF